MLAYITTVAPRWAETALSQARTRQNTEYCKALVTFWRIYPRAFAYFLSPIYFATRISDESQQTVSHQNGWVERKPLPQTFSFCSTHRSAHSVEEKKKKHVVSNHIPYRSIDDQTINSTFADTGWGVDGGIWRSEWMKLWISRLLTSTQLRDVWGEVGGQFDYFHWCLRCRVSITFWIRR